jgi:hypothetical protein
MSVTTVLDAVVMALWAAVGVRLYRTLDAPRLPQIISRPAGAVVRLPLITVLGALTLLTPDSPVKYVPFGIMLAAVGWELTIESAALVRWSRRRRVSRAS